MDLFRSFRAPPKGPDDFLGNSNGPIIIDYELLEPSSVTDDANGCAAAFPDTTDVIRLIFASGVRERNLTDTAGNVPFDNLGTAASEERANEMFTVAPKFSGLFSRCACSSSWLVLGVQYCPLQPIRKVEGETPKSTVQLVVSSADNLGETVLSDMRITVLKCWERFS